MRSALWSISPALASIKRTTGSSYTSIVALRYCKLTICSRKIYLHALALDEKNGLCPDKRKIAPLTRKIAPSEMELWIKHRDTHTCKKGPIRLINLLKGNVWKINILWKNCSSTALRNIEIIICFQLMEYELHKFVTEVNKFITLPS